MTTTYTFTPATRADHDDQLIGCRWPHSNNPDTVQGCVDHYNDFVQRKVNLGSSLLEASELALRSREDSYGSIKETDRKSAQAVIDTVVGYFESKKATPHCRTCTCDQ